MDKNMLGEMKMPWGNVFSGEKKRNKEMVVYLTGFFMAGLIIVSGIFFWKSRSDNGEQPAENKSLNKEVNGLLIAPAQKDNLEQNNKDAQGTNDSGFESAMYGATKGVMMKNAEAKLSKEQFHNGKTSLQISWGEGQDRSVQLKDYLVVQKDKYYKIGFWIFSEKETQLDLRVASSDEVLPVASVGVVIDAENKFRYYEYNFRAPLDATSLEFAATTNGAATFFVDDVKLFQLNIEKEENLAQIKKTLRGENYEAFVGEKQLLRTENSDALIEPKTLLGQLFTPKFSSLSSVTFALIKKGDGGTGEYGLELREYNEKTQLILAQKIAVKNFFAKDVTLENTTFPLAAKLEVGKKYWLGFNNSAAKTSAENYLAVGGTNDNGAYAEGNIFLQKGENKFFTEEKDLYFSTSYMNENAQGADALPLGETLYDLGQGKNRMDYEISALDRSSALNIFAEKDSSIDKSGNVVLNSDSAYLAYQIETKGRNVNRVSVQNILFNNNISIALSTDGKEWVEIFSDNSGKPTQNSGKIDVVFKKQAQTVFVKMKKNGESSSLFSKAYVIIDLSE